MPYHTHGQYSACVQEKRSSDFKGLSHLVYTSEDNISSLEGKRIYITDVFLSTNDIVTENNYYKGSSSLRLLFKLVLRLRALETKAGILLHVIHIFEEWMKECGIDGLSRGSTLEQ